MKKSIVIVIAALLALALAATVVMAAPGSPGTAGPGGKQGCWQQGQGQAVVLSDAQKQEMTALRQQMLEVKKQTFAKQVEWGHMTKEQADARIANMENRMKTAADNGYSCGGFGQGKGPGHGGRGCGNLGPGQQQPTK